MATRRELLMTIAASALALPFRAGAQGEDAAVAAIQGFYDKLQAALGQTDPKQRLAAASEAMTGAFDLGAMARLAVGPQWSKIPPAQQAALQEAFGRFFVAGYASQLGKMGGGRFEVMPNTEPRTGGQLVHTRVIDLQGKTTAVDYVVNGDGRITDIYLGGSVSMLAARRAEFDKPLKAGGPEALEAYLRKRADELTSGT